jgi:hypothetical protein
VKVAVAAARNREELSACLVFGVWLDEACDEATHDKRWNPRQVKSQHVQVTTGASKRVGDVSFHFIREVKGYKQI